MNLQIFIPLLFICSCGLLQQDRQDFADRRYTYKDDFDDEQPGELPGYWVEKLGQHSWVVDMDRKNRHSEKELCSLLGKHHNCFTK